MNPRPTTALLAAAATLASMLAGAAPADTVEIYSAGSLRVVWTEVAAQAGPALNIEVKPTFGGSGLLRERIEKGERPDLFTSADLGSPRKLEAEGRTVLPVAALARNRMCVVSRRGAGVTTANLIDRLLAKGVRLRTSTPVADPAGDYAWAIIDRIEALRPGAAAVLKAKAEASMNLHAESASPGQNPMAALFATKQIDMVITYCSGVDSLTQDAAELVALPVPDKLDPHPVYGLAILSDRPAALRLALYLQSEKGQAIIARAGLVPLTEPPPPQQ
ncbi:MAG TPA: substrate-binding domain-containing protein [Steroidobacteraceae bacterium]|nr:substrate-binding domain-containing protein [Steroidobacteraceae bacterium]